VAIFEKSHLNSGASGRCGGGIRQQWSTEDNIDLMKESARQFARFPQEVGFNNWFRQGGYLFLLYSDDQLAQFEKIVALQNSCGVPTRILSVAEIRRLVPELNTDGVVAGTYHKGDGSFFPFAVVWGYAEAIRRMGGRIHTFTEVVGFETILDRITAVETNRGKFECDIVVNACGVDSPKLAEFVGEKLPNEPEKHEIIATQPLRIFLKTAVIPMDTSLFVTQMLRGEVVSCVGLPKRQEPNIKGSLEFLKYISGILCRLFPRLSGVSILRHWAGYYDITPDTNPILGPLGKWSNFYQLSGFMGHGFMMAPAVGRRYAEWILFGKHGDWVDRFRHDRFEKGKLDTESMIIG
ncbi:MAG TPA: FAD-binding oxidoreductase, partial [Proteobacteria bacterium]|nr:FAD-binding oxidoreductase [Pseudomonadota bacterium]